MAGEVSLQGRQSYRLSKSPYVLQAASSASSGWALRALARLADARAAQEAAEARRRAVEQTKERFEINSADSGHNRHGGDSFGFSPGLTPERVLRDAGF
jgi:hypothetical protein